MIEEKIITNNITLLNWYFKYNGNIILNEEKEKLFNILTLAILEDPYIFIRIVLYIANTRKTNKQEIQYKLLLHFISTMFPEIVMANIQLFINLGKKDDILYFLQTPNITERIITWIKHKSKLDNDFNTLLNGELINSKINRIIYYKPKLNKKAKWDIFLYKILDDPTFNGITV